MITSRAAERVLIAVFLLSLLIQLTIGTVMFGISAIRAQDLEALYVKILAVYSVPIGAIMGGLFARTSRRKPTASGTAFSTAVVLTLLWNLLLIGRSVVFAFADRDSTTSLMSYFDTVAAGGSFLITGVLAYFFAK